MSEKHEDGFALQGWHVDKRVNIGHIVTTVVMAVGLISAYYSHDTRISTLEVRQQEFKQRLDRSDKRLNADLTEIKHTLIRIESKVDGKADK